MCTWEYVHACVFCACMCTHMHVYCRSACEVKHELKRAALNRCSACVGDHNSSLALQHSQEHASSPGTHLPASLSCSSIANAESSNLRQVSCSPGQLRGYIYNYLGARQRPTLTPSTSLIVCSLFTLRCWLSAGSDGFISNMLVNVLA